MILEVGADKIGRGTETGKGAGDRTESGAESGAYLKLVTSSPRSRAVSSRETVFREPLEREG